jgi:hypothetical protein
MAPPSIAAPEPSVRARYMQTFARHVDRLPAEDREAIRSAIPAATWTAIESAGLLGWLPVQMNIDCTRAVANRLGPERTHQFFRELVLAATDSPLLRGFVQAVLRVAVPDAGLYLPWVARGFELVFRDAGRWKVLEREIGWALLQLEELPRQSVTDLLWLKSVASSLCGLLDLANSVGTVAVHEVDIKLRRATFATKWKKV